MRAGSTGAFEAPSSNPTSSCSKPFFRKGPDPAVIGKPGLPVRQPSVTPSASFLATTKMAINAGQAQGMKIDNGADMVLRHVAEAEGKSVQGLETLEFQLNMFNAMPPAASPAPRLKAGDPVGEAPMQSLSRAMTEMQSAWKRGDQSVFVRMLGQFEAGSPATYRMMFTERNARWADWIKARMQTPGTVFVAVGAGHLAGKDSVLVRLAEKGSLPSGSTDHPETCVRRRPALGRALPAMVIPGGVARGFSNRSIAK